MPGLITLLNLLFRAAIWGVFRPGVLMPVRLSFFKTCKNNFTIIQADMHYIFSASWGLRLNLPPFLTLPGGYTSQPGHPSLYSPCSGTSRKSPLLLPASPWFSSVPWFPVHLKEKLPLPPVAAELSFHFLFPEKLQPTRRRLSPKPTIPISLFLILMFSLSSYFCPVLIPERLRCHVVPFLILLQLYYT